MSTLDVSDDRLIRINNLRRVCAERKLKPADLHKLLPYARYTYWRDVLETDKKPFGEKAARKAEAGLGLPDRWLDTPHGVSESRSTVLPAMSPAEEIQRSDASETLWRQWADLIADICTERNKQMLPSLFLVVTDLAVELYGDAADKRKALTVLDKLSPLVHHSGKSNRE